MTPPIEVAKDARWGLPCLAYNVQVDLTALAGELTALQHVLDEAASLPLYQTPAPTLHASIYGIVPVHWASDDKTQVWTSVAPRMLATLRDACRKQVEPVVLAFRTLRVFPRAIVAVAEDRSGFVERVRTRLRDVSDPRVPTPHYDMVHTTVARFAASGPLSDAQRERVERIALSCHGPVRGLWLVRERVYPSLVTDPLEHIPLGEP